MKSIIRKLAFSTAAAMGLALSSANAGGEMQFNNMKINSIRAVGQYADPTYANTLELWFSTTVPDPAGTPCTTNYRVFIDAKNYHIVAAAQLAMAKGRLVNVALDPALPIRGGACEVVYLDVLPTAAP